MSAERLSPAGLAPPDEPYVHAVRAGNTLYMAGQVAFDERNEVVGHAVLGVAVTRLAPSIAGHATSKNPAAGFRNLATSLIRRLGRPIAEARENFREARAEAIKVMTGRIV